ncbi:MAG: hypothetical protein NC079_10375 [Clostridium sp.]|nr:hypothetical protein [Acetatifactor muris]MCM1526366.1 hypothetical protein [Bacteroides sp.]MCM1563998.1 hypothetical protein [Clostridium sp.]
MDTFMDKLAQKFTAQEMIKANAIAETEEMNRLKIQVQEYTECLNRMQQICDEMEQTAEAARNKVEQAHFSTDELKEQLLAIRLDMQNMQTEQEAEEDGEEPAGYSAEARFAEQIDDLITSQTSQLEHIKSLQMDQMEMMRGMQQSQLDSVRELQQEHLNDLSGMQSTQVEMLKNSLEDQLDSMRSMVKAQIAGIKGGQDGQLDGMRQVLDEQKAAMETRLGEMNTNLETHLNDANEFVHKECVKVYRNVQAVVGEENSKQSDNLDYMMRPIADKVKKVFSVAAVAVALSVVSIVLQVLNLLHIF